MARHNPTLGRARLQSSRSAIDPKAISAASFDIRVGADPGRPARTSKPKSPHSLYPNRAAEQGSGAYCWSRTLRQFMRSF